MSTPLTNTRKACLSCFSLFQIYSCSNTTKNVEFTCSVLHTPNICSLQGYAGLTKLRIFRAYFLCFLSLCTKYMLCSLSAAMLALTFPKVQILRLLMLLTMFGSVLVVLFLRLLRSLYLILGSCSSCSLVSLSFFIFLIFFCFIYLLVCEVTPA